MGSPPRMRGKGNQDVNGPSNAGITPAYAGKSMPKIPDNAAGQDHPRVCGEKAILPINSQA